MLCGGSTVSLGIVVLTIFFKGFAALRREGSATSFDATYELSTESAR